MKQNTFGNDASPLQGVTIFANKRPDASHRANFPGAYGTYDIPAANSERPMLLQNRCVTSHIIIGRIISLVLAVVLAAACSTRVEYPNDADQQPIHNSINLNTASAEELDRLPNIGRKTAESIVAFRDEHGPFRRPEQLMLIRGVSETRFIEIRDLIRTR
jgi:competence ComEA-like helix-hairpin-helix protein